MGEGHQEFDSLAAASPLESVLWQFEAAWKGRDTPSLAQYLERADAAQRETLLRELLAIELHWRERRGAKPAIEEYEARFPGHVPVIAAAFARRSSAAPAAAQPVYDGSITCDGPGEATDARFADRCPACGVPLPTGVEETEEGSQPLVAHYRLLEVVGRGSFGTVWKARDVELDRLVALKLPRAAALKGGMLERFRRDARLAAKLSHPNIVAVFDAHLSLRPYYIASRFIEGITLDFWMRERRGPRAAIAICRVLADALAHAHRVGVVHRDLKPTNILVDARNRPHLIDFGLGKQEGSHLRATATGDIVGTPFYMSPEQADGQGRRADHRSDIFSLGVVLYELLTGRRPFSGRTPWAVLDAVLHAAAIPPRQIDPAIPEEIEVVCLTCLEKEPQRRYQCAEQLASLLERLSATAPQTPPLRG